MIVPSLRDLLPRFRRRLRCRIAVGGDHVGLLANGDSASISYLLEPYLAARRQPMRHLDMAGLASSTQCGPFHTIVIVRYLPKEWLGPLEVFRAEGGRIIYFMDDDLMDPAAAVGLPTVYAKKIRALATRMRAQIESLCDEFWVSTPYLAGKYSQWQPVMLAPAASPEQLAHRPLVTICYHGTASHSAELAWLPAVMAEAQSICPDTLFEVFGDHSVNRAFRHLRHVAVLHPMGWPSYLAYTASVRRDIGVAPLLPGLFNAARGPTKFFDFARMGAVGIYSDVAPYRDFIRHDVDGLLLPNDPAVWAQTIAELAMDTPRRARLAAAAAERARTAAVPPEY